MVKGILADANILGHWVALLSRLESDAWRDLWAGLNLRVETFATLGLPLNTKDTDLWQACQQRQLVLITANRDAKDPDSLEAAIRAWNTPTSLPVLTLADADRIFVSSAYADQVVERLLDYLLYIDNVRGTGRLYLP